MMARAGRLTRKNGFTSGATDPSSQSGSIVLFQQSAYGPASAGRSFNYGNIGYDIASLAMDATLESGQSLTKQILYRIMSYLMSLLVLTNIKGNVY